MSKVAGGGMGEELDFEEGADPFGEFSGDLSILQKRFIQARVLSDTDGEAAEHAGLNVRTVQRWKLEYPKFLLAYGTLVTSMRQGSLELMRTRVMVVAGKALEVWERYLVEEVPSRQDAERARLAKDFIVAVYNKAPVQRMPLARELTAKFDVDELTEGAMNAAS